MEDIGGAQTTMKASIEAFEPAGGAQMAPLPVGKASHDREADDGLMEDALWGFISLSESNTVCRMRHSRSAGMSLVGTRRADTRPAPTMWGT